MARGRPAALAVLSALASASASALASDALEAADADRRALTTDYSFYDPNDPTGALPPTTVYVDFQLVNLRLVDARLSSFQVSGTLYYAWRDDDLLTANGADGKPYKDGKPYGPPTPTNGLFWPQHVWSNRLGAVTESNANFVYRSAPPYWTALEPDVNPEAWVAYQVDVIATFLQPQNLRDFPFDRQLVRECPRTFRKPHLRTGRAFNLKLHSH